MQGLISPYKDSHRHTDTHRMIQFYTISHLPLPCKLDLSSYARSNSGQVSSHWPDLGHCGERKLHFKQVSYLVAAACNCLLDSGSRSPAHLTQNARPLPTSVVHWIRVGTSKLCSDFLEEGFEGRTP